VPLWPPVTEIHPADEVVVHWHAAPIATVSDVGPPSGPTFTVEGLTVASHARALCETTTVWPATVTEPLRALPAFGATEIARLPGPLPGDPEVT